jgi:hypothetical protein
VRNPQTATEWEQLVREDAAGASRERDGAVTKQRRVVRSVAETSNRCSCSMPDPACSDRHCDNCGDLRPDRDCVICRLEISDTRPYAAEVDRD